MLHIEIWLIYRQKLETAENSSKIKLQKSIEVRICKGEYI